LVHTIPMLVKAHMVNQAFETEKVIAATFELSEPFLELLGGKIPPNYIEKIQEIYSDVMYKAFDTGIKSAEVKSKSTQIDLKLSGEELEHELAVKMPMYFGVKQDLSLLFREQLGDLLDTAGDTKENIFKQFEVDLDKSYRDGLKEYLLNDAPSEEEIDENVSPVEEDVLEEAEEEEEEEIDFDEELEDEEEEEDEAALEEVKEDDNNRKDELDATSVTALKVWDAYASEELKELFTAQAEADQHIENAEMVYAFNDWLVKGNNAAHYIPFESNIVKNAVDKAVVQRLEKYARLLKDSTAEKVLRYTLGLPTGKKSHGAAKVEKEDKEGKDNKDNKDNKGSVINKLEAYTKLLKDPEAEKVLRYYLGLPIKKVSGSVIAPSLVGSYNPLSLKRKILSLLESGKSELVASIDDDNYQTVVIECITSDLNNMPESIALRYIGKKLGVTAESFTELDQKMDVLAQKLDRSMELPGECVFVKMGDDLCLTYTFKTATARKQKSRLTARDQNEIEALSRLSKSKTIRDITKASPQVSEYMKKVLNDIRWGKLGVAEGGTRLQANVEDVVAEVFGSDGLSYYQYLRNKR